MVRAIFKGQPTQAGSAMYYPEWYADLFAKVDGIKTAYLAGWLDQAGTRLVNGPDLRQMTEQGAGADITATENAALGQLAMNFTGKVIDTGHAGAEEWTIIAVGEITAAQVASPAHQWFIYREDATNGPLIMGLSPSGNLQMLASGEAVDDTAVEGPFVAMATSRRISGTQSTFSLYINDFETPVDTLTETLNIGTGGNYKIGGRGASDILWGAGLSALLIADRDLTEDTADAANVAAALDAALAWATPS